MKNTTQQPVKRKWTGPIDNIRHKWVNVSVDICDGPHFLVIIIVVFVVVVVAAAAAALS